MKERFRKIMKGLTILLCSVAGMWEYMQVFMYYDLPQAIIVLPVIGAIATIVLGKWGFLVLATTSALGIVFQLVADSANGLGFVGMSKVSIIINILLIVVVMMAIGMVAGLLIRVLMLRKKSFAVGMVCCVIGVILTFGVGIRIFGNPLYPVKARVAIHKYAEKYRTDSYPISEIVVYYSLEAGQYHGQVVMSDGYRYAMYHDKKTGIVYEIE